ncbi:hypothetical protein PMKS-004180 [Pichia membranifaciens]|uniref:Uncharacterized protein n=1 Tax=Pichia membranifaciens TaxID=4926 RepID=A0A1Q2YMQ3_9ASCO|nr:hypothetical protein PMKS-004180 [Pichia membranifaciens]
MKTRRNMRYLRQVSHGDTVERVDTEMDAVDGAESQEQLLPNGELRVAGEEDKVPGMALAPPLGSNVVGGQVEVEEEVVDGVADEQLVHEKVFQPCRRALTVHAGRVDAGHLPIPAISR